MPMDILGDLIIPNRVLICRYMMWCLLTDRTSRRHVPNGSADLTAKRANRDTPVYQSAQYAKNISDSVGWYIEFR